jgi:hypothetical protein
VKLLHACTLINSPGPLAWASGTFGLSWTRPKNKNKQNKQNKKCINKNFACLRIFFYQYTGVEIKILHVLKKKYFLLFTDIKIRNKKKYFSGYEFLPTPELELFVVKFFNWNYLWWNIYQRHSWNYS